MIRPVYRSMEALQARTAEPDSFGKVPFSSTIEIQGPGGNPGAFTVSSAGCRVIASAARRVSGWSHNRYCLASQRASDIWIWTCILLIESPNVIYRIMCHEL